MRRVALAFLLALAACAPMTAPMGDAVTQPVFLQSRFVTRDGMSLPLRQWSPDALAEGGTPRAIIIALHGMSDYSNAFDGAAKTWATRGIVTYAYDQRGFGSGPNPGLWAGAPIMRDDLRDAVAATHASWPGVPVYALGESMGGAVLLTALAEPQRLNIAGAILVAPAVWARSTMPISYRVTLFLAARLAPGLVLSNNAAKSVVRIVPSDNIEMLRALGRDPLFQKRTRVDVLFGLVNLMDEAETAPARMGETPPILYLYGRNDQIIPAAPAGAVIAALGPRARVTRYDRGYHMLLRDLEGPAVQGDVADWMGFPPDGIKATATKAPPPRFHPVTQREKPS